MFLWCCSDSVLISYGIVRMAWWFLILACSGGAVLWAGVAALLGVRRHLKASAALKKKGLEREPDSL